MFIISVEQFLALFRRRLCCFAVHVLLDKLGLTLMIYFIVYDIIIIIIIIN